MYGKHTQGVAVLMALIGQAPSKKESMTGHVSGLPASEAAREAQVSVASTKPVLSGNALLQVASC